MIINETVATCFLEACPSRGAALRQSQLRVETEVLGVTRQRSGVRAPRLVTSFTHQATYLDSEIASPPAARTQSPPRSLRPNGTVSLFAESPGDRLPAIGSIAILLGVLVSFLTMVSPLSA